MKCLFKSILTNKALFAGVILIPTLAHAQVDMTWFNSVISGIGRTISALIPAFVGLALAVFVWGLVVFIWNSGNDSAKQEGKNKMIWGVLALFVIVSIWGIIALLNVIFGVTPTAAPPSMPTLPSSISFPT